MRYRLRIEDTHGNFIHFVGVPTGRKVEVDIAAVDLNRFFAGMQLYFVASTYCMEYTAWRIDATA